MELTCKDCGVKYEITPNEEAFFNSKGFPLPKRCKECRAERGVYDPKTIAQKLGYKGNALTHGIEEVNGILVKLGIA